jgi:GH24 family phage-related lysozyme (muramidase)
MNIEELRETLKVDEGNVKSIYLDHLNLPTTGIGHLITEWDEE